MYAVALDRHATSNEIDHAIVLHHLDRKMTEPGESGALSMAEHKDELVMFDCNG